MKPRVFFFHYNKPASQAQKKNVLTVHWKGACHLAHHIQCDAAIWTSHRKSQPRCVIKGKAETCEFYTTAKGETLAVIS